MPNVGRPSRDCQTCRRRRLKCDLVRPQCNQCVRKGLACPGYLTEFDMRLHVSSVSSFQPGSKKTRRKTIPTGKQDVMALLWEARGAPAKQDALVRALYPLPYSLADYWETHCLPLVVSKLQSIYFMSPCVFNTALRQFTKMNDKSHLYLVCRAVGTAFLGNMDKSRKAAIEQAKAYSASLAAVNVAIQDPQQYKTDDTLLSICLLAFYEVVTNAEDRNRSFFFESTAYRAHTKGMVDLITLRGVQGLDTRDSRNIISMVLCHILTRVFLHKRSSLHHTDPGVTPFWLLEFYRRCVPAEYPIVRSFLFSYHCIYLTRRIRDLLEAGDPVELLSNASSIINALDEIEQQVYPFTSEQVAITGLTLDPPLKCPPLDKKLHTMNSRLRRRQYITRMLLSFHALDFVLCASKVPGCTSQEQSTFENLGQRYIAEINHLAKQLPDLDHSLFHENAAKDLNGQRFITTVMLRYTFLVLIGYESTLR